MMSDLRVPFKCVGPISLPNRGPTPGATVVFGLVTIAATSCFAMVSGCERSNPPAAHSRATTALPQARRDVAVPEQDPATAAASPAAALPEASRSAPSVTPPAQSAGVPEPAVAPQAAATKQAHVKLPEPVNEDPGGQPWLKGVKLPYEYWETQYFNGQRVGVTHCKVERLQLNQIDMQRLKVTSVTTMEALRDGQSVRQKLTVETYEHADGKVDSFFETISGNVGKATRVEGSVSFGQLKLTTTTGETASVTTLDWYDSTWGPMGVQQLLMRRPIRSGERRIANVFMPQLHKVARVTLTAGTEEETTFAEGVQRLLPVEMLMQLEQQGVRIRMWVDSKGQVQKSIWPEGMNLATYRVSREEAERIEDQGKIELFAATAIQLTPPPLMDAEKAERVVYLIESTDAEPHRLFSHETNQTLRQRPPFRVEVTVLRPQVESPVLPGVTQSPPTPECLATSALIKTDDPFIEKLAAQLAEDAQEPAAVALKLTEAVHRTIRKKNFSRAFDSAQDVARSLEGDCTEHAVLLTALLRSRRIPARIASGLILKNADEGSSFLYHMWVEAWVGDHWLPLDPTLGTLTHCGYIKFLETPLAGSNPYSALLPVLSSMGKLQISVKEKSP